MIIGAGPVGLSLAMALTRRGIHVEVFEADEKLNREIRASTFHPPTLESFADWGVLDTVLENGHIVDRLQYWERANRELIAEFDYGLIADDTSYPHRVQCPQHILTRLLLPVVQASEYGQVHMGHRLLHGSFAFHP